MNEANECFRRSEKREWKSLGQRIAGKGSELEIPAEIDGGMVGAEMMRACEKP